MPVVHVINRAGEPDDEGLALMVELLHKRVDSQLLEAGVARKLALASGGHVRDFIRLARAAANRFGESITLQHAEAAVNDMVAYYDNLYDAEYAEALRYVHKQRLLPRREFDGQLVNKLLVLPYQNGEPWCALHPCVLLGPRLSDLTNQGAAAGKPGTRTKRGKGQAKRR
jgi:hypothetical protein